MAKRRTKKQEELELIIEEPRGFKYPDFQQSIQSLRLRLKEVSSEHSPLLEKWVVTLAQIDKEMRHLERIERFTQALTKKNSTPSGQ